MQPFIDIFPTTLVDDLKKPWNGVFITVHSLALPESEQHFYVSPVTYQHAERFESCLLQVPAFLPWRVAMMSVTGQISIFLSREALTATARTSLESEHGCRYSILLELPSFDVLRQHVYY